MKMAEKGTAPVGRDRERTQLLKPPSPAPQNRPPPLSRPPNLLRSSKPGRLPRVTAVTSDGLRRKQGGTVEFDSFTPEKLQG